MTRVTVVLAVVGALGCAHGPLWKSPTDQAQTVALWRTLAARYADRTIVAGYDLLNEPIPDRDADLVDLYRRIIAGIREVDTHHLVLVEGTRFATDFSALRGTLDGNQAYSFHLYTWFGNDPVKAVTGYEAIAQKQGVPFWNGEYGENSYQQVEKTLAAIRAGEDSGDVAGAGFWTWKHALPHGTPGLAGFPAPDDWRRLIVWAAGGGGSPPSRAEALAAMEAFLSGARMSQCTVDPRMAALLRPRAEPTWPGHDGGYVHREDTGLVDGAGQRVRLEGVNLGGWLLWEAWIWGATLSIWHLDEQAHSQIAQRLASLVGEPAEAAFEARVYREFIGEEDLARIAALGFNVVRVPISARALERGAWEVLDRLIDAAERLGVYLVLDLHAAPGGQSPYFIADPRE